MPDTVDEIIPALEQIAANMATAGLDDLRQLAEVHAQLEQVTESLREVHPAAARLSQGLSVAAERIILEEYGEAADPLDALDRGIAMLRQQVVAGNGAAPRDNPQLLKEIGYIMGGWDGQEPGGPAEEASEELRPEGLVAMSADEGAALAAVVLPDETGPDDLARSAGDEGEEPAPPVEIVAADLEPVEVDKEIFFDFAPEAQEHLATAETTLLSLEASPDDTELLNAVFRSFHTIKGAAGFLNLQDVTRVAHAVEDVLDSARRGDVRFNAAISDVTLEAIDLLKELIQTVEDSVDAGPVAPRDVTAFTAKVRGVAAGESSPPESMSPASDEIPDTGEDTVVEIVSPVVAEPEAPAPAAPGQTGGNGAAAPDGKHHDQLFVRVGTEKLDQLVSMVGELVIGQTQVSQNPEIRDSGDQRLTGDIGQLDRITRDLQEVAMSMRMVPIRGTFERMARTVRDLCRKCGKQVDFQMAGEETELDKNVVEELVDPLTHMVRNAVDHGMETPQERGAAGKPETGVVKLEAYHQGGNIVIELSDDGQGLDRDKIRQKAVASGLYREEEQLTDEQIYDVIFQPGLSTADKISDVSGRGVGMDVVRRSMEKLRGTVEVSSEKGSGSTFTTRLPLTLAIIDGMVIGVGEERYVLPLTSIVQSLRPTQEQVFTAMQEGEMVKVQGELHPVVRLYERFAVSPKNENPWESLVVLIEAEGGSCGLVVDDLLGIQQVVIKGLDDDLRNDKSLSGCTILGDGKVGLILDANGLVPSRNGLAA